MPPPLKHLEATVLFSRLAQSAAALLLLTIGLAAPVHAQQNKQIISGTWYEDRAVGFSSTTSLFLAFSQTPPDKFLNITNVSCSVTVQPGQAVSYILLSGGTTSGNNDLGRPYSLKGNATPETVGQLKYYSIVQNGIFFKFGPGRFPSIEFDTASTGSLTTGASCVIVGNLTDN
jgi:hypothetical protein